MNCLRVCVCLCVWFTRACFAQLHRTDKESRLVRGLVMDHGGRHPDMPSRLEKCYILTLNVSLEYEKSEVTATMSYSTAAERERVRACVRVRARARARVCVCVFVFVCV
jgi:T-complex protein 1 subunit zeta